MPTGEAWRSLVFGELLFDLLPDGEVLGGAPANVAYRLTTLGLPTLLVSRVGRDERGALAMEELRRLGMETCGIETDPTRPTGTVPVTYRADGTHDFNITRDVAFDHIAADGVALDAAERVECLAFGTLAQRSPVSRRALEGLLEATRARWRVCDVNLRRDCFTEESLRFSLAHANVLKLNAEEVPELARLEPGSSTEPRSFCAAAVERWRLDAAVVTRGADGAVAANAMGEVAEVPGLPVDVVDTIGSGDAFTAGFIAALMEGHGLVECCARGNSLGALVAATRGATAPVNLGRLESERARL